MSSLRPSISPRAWAMLILIGFSGMLFSVDRQTLAVLKPFLSEHYGWTDQDYAWLVVSFMGPYTLCYLFTGHLIDRWGARRMLPLMLGLMSLATIATALSDHLWSIGFWRCVLGAASAGIAPCAMVSIVT